MTKMERRSFAFTLKQHEARSAPSDPDCDCDPDDEDCDCDEEDRGFTGNASVFNSDSLDLGGFTEQVAPGAFAESIANAYAGQSRIFALWAHDECQPPLASTANSLKLTETPHGLQVAFDTDRMTPAQLAATAAGDMQMSFGFAVQSENWAERADGTIVRTILKADLFEVSPVVFPAYPDTDAAIRKLEDFKACRAANPEGTDEITITDDLTSVIKEIVAISDEQRSQTKYSENEVRLQAKLAIRKRWLERKERK